MNLSGGRNMRPPGGWKSDSIGLVTSEMGLQDVNRLPCLYP